MVSGRPFSDDAHYVNQIGVELSMAVTDTFKRKVRFGFRLGAIVTGIGLALRIAATKLSWEAIGNGVWSKSKESELMLIHLSLATIAFGMSLLVVTLNCWLRAEGDGTKETD